MHVRIRAKSLKPGKLSHLNHWFKVIGPQRHHGELISLDKLELRRHYRGLRNALTPLQRTVMDQAINATVTRMVLDSGARTIAAYDAFDGEPGLQYALSRLAELDVSIVLPVLDPDTAQRQLLFRSWTPGGCTRPNRMGIAEPAGGAIVPTDALDIVLLPLVAWDDSGGRLGMGRACYDQTLARCASHARPRRIGIGYSLQKAARLPRDDWDIPLHAVITEDGLFTCRQ